MFEPVSQTLPVMILSYLLGSVPFGLVLTKLAGLGDIRHIGSGNIGATNVLRTGKKGLAFLTLFLDGSKGAVAVLLTQTLTNTNDLALLSGLAVLFGHLFPVWLKFRGGKGVATVAGVVTALAWPVGLAGIGTWVLTAVITRYSSLAALVSLALAPIYALLLRPVDGDLVWLLAGMATLIFWTHRANIQRLCNGTESKIGAKGKKSDDSPSAE